ncbi:hypothetical protein AGMMS49579_05830 [Spirochaetia bacterium]|nr:hypothetical protein AGMMS49579_05830 [Spirochaetia bacterium]
MRHFFVWLFLTVILFLPASAFAHGVDISDVTGRTGVRTIRFGYTDGEYMLFAKVKVYAPSAPDAAVQESMTDRDGYFSFVPFEDGDWQLSAEDGMGHKGEIVITVADGTAQGMADVPNTSSSGKLPRPIAIVLGLSLILNVFAFYRFVLKKSADKKEASHAH